MSDEIPDFMSFFRRAALSISLVVVAMIVTIYCAGAFGMAVQTLWELSTTVAQALMVTFLVVVGMGGFVYAWKAGMEALGRSPLVSSPELDAVQGHRRTAAIASGVVSFFVVLSIVAYLLPGPVPTLVSMSVLAFSVIAGFVGCVRMFRLPGDDPERNR